MNLVDITEEDLNGILFVEFPNDMPLSECRDSLELLITDCYDELFGDTPEDEALQMCISPFWVARAISKKSYNEYLKCDKATRKQWIEWLKNERKRKFEESKKGLINSKI